jgi:uncharacterized protein YcfJ
MKTTMISGIWILSIVLLGAGCATAPTPSQQATALGAGMGAALGGVLGHNLGNSSSDRDLGIAAGTLLGGALGHQMGRQQELQTQVNTLQQQQFMTTIWVENANGSRTPVVLRQTDGGQSVGPRGEYYTIRPSQQQLGPVYGL